MYMQQVKNKVQYLIGDESNLEKVGNLPALPIFEEEVLDLLEEVATAIFSDKDCRQYPDVLTFGFWCRRASLLKQKEDYGDGYRYLGRGLVFHISPSNLPIIFAYSMVAGLLAGNANIVRVPSRDFSQVEYICGLFRELLAQEKYQSLVPYLTCVKYDHRETNATDQFSGICDVRVVWGGDHTITDVRKSPLKPKAYEIVFSDRYSVCVIDSDAWLECRDKGRYIKGFYNDTYLNDQNACSAPQLVLWLGDKIEEARSDLWNLLEELVRSEYTLTGTQSVMKLESFYRMVEKLPDLRLCSENNYIVRVWASEIRPELMDNIPGSGFFIESKAANITALAPLLRQRCQTLAYYGIELTVFNQLLSQTGPLGIDRIVPIGQTLDFSLTWDGYDIIRSLSRKIIIERPTF